MEMKSFDVLTRQLSEVGATRRLVTRTLARALLGGVLAGVAARCGLAEPAAAKSKHHKAKPKPKYTSQAQWQTHGQAHAEGKRKGKKRHKKSPLPPLPLGCQNCNECQMCQDGACVPDPDLGGVPCQGSGPTCSHCLNGVCTVNEQRPCPDGICAHRGTCCAGEKWCEDHNTSTGFSCIDPNRCCPRERTCPDGTCGTNTRCCSNERKCPGGGCVPLGQCCPSETSAHYCPATPEYPQGVCCTPPEGLSCPIFVGCAGANGHDLACNWTSC
jgi:hypothetical protein